MDRLREAVEIAEQFSAPSLIRELAAVARSVLDAPRIWWCVEHGATGESTGCHIGWRHQERPHPADSPCRMVEASVVVGDPTTNSVQDGSSLGVDDPQGGEQ